MPTININEENHRDLSFYSSICGKKMQDIVNNLLSDYLKPYREKRLELKFQ
jgi:hypothetical protein